jgi:hypothetical protein
MCPEVYTLTFVSIVWFTNFMDGVVYDITAISEVSSIISITIEDAI